MTVSFLACCIKYSAATRDLFHRFKNMLTRINNGSTPKCSHSQRGVPRSGGLSSLLSAPSQIQSVRSIRASRRRVNVHESQFAKGQLMCTLMPNRSVHCLFGGISHA